MATFSVINTDDSGLGSLRQAIEDANATSGLDTIEFDEELSGQEITLISGELQITDDLTINGLGADSLTISGNNDSRVFLVDDSSDDSQIEVTIDNLTITDGSADFGAGIFNRENLTVTNSVLSDNSATADGSAIFNVNSGTVEVSNSTLRNNFAELRGGGVSNGSIDFDIDGGTVKINNSTINNNEADVGGGIFNQENGFLILTNSTISGNLGINGGAAIDNDGTVEISSSTIAQNISTDDVGGIDNVVAPLELENTIIAGNEGLFPDVSGIFISNGYNLIGNGIDSTGFNSPGDQVGTSNNPIEPLLSPLQDNGGSTFTHALLTDSPAIDGGNPDFEPPPEFDQRGEGFERILDGDADGIATVDIGAYELAGEPSVEIIGTEEDDLLTGSNGADQISGLGGNDILQGLAGNDQISGGSGNDLIAAGNGNDTVTGDGSSDDIVGGQGDDILDGNAGADRILGELGDDTINGGSGNDVLSGGEDNDLVIGAGGSDRLFGGSGNDDLIGRDGQDTLTGGLGNDSLNGGTNSDRLIGVNPLSAGVGEVDDLAGGGGTGRRRGRDTFVLGDEDRVYYDDGDSLTRGESDFALISDFDPSRDFIQLNGSPELYSLDFFTSESGTVDADLIYDPGVLARGEVIATLQDVSPDLTLSDSTFTFV